MFHNKKANVAKILEPSDLTERSIRSDLAIILHEKENVSIPVLVGLGSVHHS